MTYWAEMHTYVYSILPFLILTVTNIFLVYFTVLRKSAIERTSRDKAKRMPLTASVLAMTASFIILTGPAAIANDYFYNQLAYDITGSTILGFLSMLRFVQPFSSNLFVLMMFDKKFQKEVKLLLFF